MRYRGFFAPLLALGLMTSAAPSLADVGPGRRAPTQAAADVREGAFVLAPQAFLAFCARYPADCASTGSNQIRLDGDAMAKLSAVNASVNRRVAPVELTGKDVWRLGLSAGHCAIYAVQKRHDLLAQGFPAAALSLAVVTTRSSQLHLVLVVRTDQGAVVLDNLNGRIMPWTQTAYQYRRIQSADNPMLWVSVAGSRPVQPAVAALSAPDGEGRPVPVPSFADRPQQDLVEVASRS